MLIIIYDAALCYKTNLAPGDDFTIEAVRVVSRIPNILVNILFKYMSPDTVVYA